jgi:hypothetical protein
VNIAKALTLTGQDNPSQHFTTFSQSLDFDLVEKALVATGKASIRKRKLPAERVITLIIGMGLLRDRSIQAVCDHLHLTLADQQGQTQSIRSSSLANARERLSSGPLEELFKLTAQGFCKSYTVFDNWHGLTTYGIDGSTMAVPDSEENRQEFGLVQSGRGESGYPQARLVGLMRLGSHRLVSLKIGSYAEGEVSLAEGLYELIEDNSLLIVDRGLLCWSRFWHYQQKGINRHWLVRAKSNLKWKVLKQLGEGDELVEISFTRAALKEDPALPKTMLAGVISYTIPGFRPQKLITSLLDPIAYPALAIIEVYHQRWEYELALDEVKTHSLERTEAIRSRSPELVRQELWGLALTYNLVRQEMARVAADLGVLPTGLSYRWCLLLLRNLWLSAWVVAAATVPRHLEQLAADVSNLLLPQRRSSRSNPREVKVKMSGYKKKRRGVA